MAVKGGVCRLAAATRADKKPETRPAGSSFAGFTQAQRCSLGATHLNALGHTDTTRYLDHRLITLLLEASCRSPRSLSSTLASLSHLLYQQADNAAGLSAWHSTSLPISCLPVSLARSLSPPPSSSSILVSLITIQQTAAVESAER